MFNVKLKIYLILVARKVNYVIHKNYLEIIKVKPI